jgi:hypothetical protein
VEPNALKFVRASNRVDYHVQPEKKKVKLQVSGPRKKKKKKKILYGVAELLSKKIPRI